MKSIILAAGRGSRIPEISQTKPKCLIKINGKTILERQIMLMKKNSFHITPRTRRSTKRKSRTSKKSTRTTITTI